MTQIPSGGASQIRAVLFDLGATLVDPHPSSRELILQVLRTHGADVEAAALERAEPAAWKAVSCRLPFKRYDHEEALAFWDDFYVVLLDGMAVAHDAGLRRRIYDAFQCIENWRLYPDVLPVLEMLRDGGYRLGLVSNWERWLDELLIALGIHTMFDVVVGSDAFGRAKPHPSIFLHALDALDTKPEHAVHIGDNPRDDVAGARAAGVHPILLDRRGDCPQADVDRIHSLEQLLARLNR